MIFRNSSFRTLVSNNVAVPKLLSPGLKYDGLFGPLTPGILKAPPMPRYRDQEEDDRDNDETDFDDALEEPDEEPTTPCPYCRKEILEDSPRCPYCERYISDEDHAGPNKPLWVILTALICLGIAIWWVFASF